MSKYDPYDEHIPATAIGRPNSDFFKNRDPIFPPPPAADKKQYEVNMNKLEDDLKKVDPLDAIAETVLDLRYGSMVKLIEEIKSINSTLSESSLWRWAEKRIAKESFIDDPKPENGDDVPKPKNGKSKKDKVNDKNDERDEMSELQSKINGS